MKLNASYLWIILIVIIVICICVYRNGNISLESDHQFYERGIDAIECKLVNRTLHTIYYGSAFSVEVFNGDEWIVYDEKKSDIRFELGMQRLKPFGTSLIVFPVDIYSDFDFIGEYRIVFAVEYANRKDVLFCEYTVQ